jgi:hypothetical protein
MEEAKRDAGKAGLGVNVADTAGGRLGFPVADASYFRHNDNIIRRVATASGNLDPHQHSRPPADVYSTDGS